MEMNKELLKRVAERIVEAPQNFDMRDWFIDKSGSTGEACGTAACIAGEACLESGRAVWRNGQLELGPAVPENSFLRRHQAKGYLPKHMSWDEEGRRALDLTEEQSNRLFYKEHWPAKFNRGGSMPGTPEYACNAAARIKHFIDTDGKE